MLIGGSLHPLKRQNMSEQFIRELTIIRTALADTYRNIRKRKERKDIHLVLSLTKNCAVTTVLPLFPLM